MNAAKQTDDSIILCAAFILFIVEWIYCFKSCLCGYQLPLLLCYKILL